MAGPDYQVVLGISNLSDATEQGINFYEGSMFHFDENKLFAILHFTLEIAFTNSVAPIGFLSDDDEPANVEDVYLIGH